MVPGRLLHHDAAGEAGLRRGLPAPGGRHQDVGPRALCPRALAAAAAGEAAPSNAALADQPGVLWDGGFHLRLQGFFPLQLRNRAGRFSHQHRV